MIYSCHLAKNLSFFVYICNNNKIFKESMESMRIEGNVVDIVSREIYYGLVEVLDGRIASIVRIGAQREEALYIISGFIDSHVHIESSMLTPANFGQAVISRGTVGVVTDPHEIANVLGVDGVEFMMDSAQDAPIRVHFTIPSSVPATSFDRTGCVITSQDVERLAASGRFVGLSEVMNVPGVLFRDEEVMSKLDVARRYNLAIDGHAPLLMGDDLARYASCGITTDHECSTIEEAEAKISHGMKIEIREGSAAKNYDALKSLIRHAPESVLFCTDDSHPDEILGVGHIDKIVRRAVADGFDLFDVLTIASKNPIDHYKLDQGLLAVGSKADFIVVDNLVEFRTQQVYIDGELRYDTSATNEQQHPTTAVQINNFHHDKIELSDLRRSVIGGETIDVIGAISDSLITTHRQYTPKDTAENFESDLDANIAKIVYINRYFNTPPVVAYCHGFGFKTGALATSIAHDSHNIIAIGVSDQEILEVVNAVIEHQGGLSICYNGESYLLPLPIAGIMSNRTAAEVVANYSHQQQCIKEFVCDGMNAPFMTLSFLSLVVIPEVKIGEKGLFSYSKFGWLESCRSCDTTDE